MPNCPICQTEYIEEKVNFCSTCGWDLTPYPWVLGQIPDAFVEKQKSQLAGAKKIWSKFLATQELLNEEKAELSSQLTEQLTQLQKQLAHSRNQCRQLQAKLDIITARVTEKEEETSEQQLQLANFFHERAELATQLEAANTEVSSLQNVIQERANLAMQLVQVNTEISRFQSELTAQLVQANTEITRLQNVRQERADLVAQLAQANTKISCLQAALDTFVQPELAGKDYREFSFQVVTVDSQGRENSRQTRTARALIQELPGGRIIEMVAIPGGKFWMGSPDTDGERTEAGSPLHQVMVSPFYLGRFPVTQAQWQAVAGLPKVIRDLDPKPATFNGNNLPVEFISWYEAVEFCARLTEYTKLPYRLPSEAEWEYACRAGTTTPFHFGETISPKLVNYDGNYTYGEGKKGKYHQKTIPVGSFQVANAFGLSDMHGNVWEWCSDHWHDNYHGAPVDGSAWDDCDENHLENFKQKLNNWDDCDENHLENFKQKLNNNDNHFRPMRGGSWDNAPRDCRSALRGRNHSASRSLHLGFRVACVAARSP